MGSWKLVLLDPTCFEVITNYLSSNVLTLLDLNITCRDIYKLTQPLLSEYFYLRIIGEPPFKRNTLTSIILHHNALPTKETLLLPPAIKRVHYMSYTELSDNFLPPSVSILSLSSLTKAIPLAPGFLPPQLTRIHFSDSFNSHIGNDNLPPTLTHIWFGRKFDKPVDDLPADITHLIFGLKFNQPVDKLPRNLIFLITSTFFEQPNKDLPKSLQYLSLGRRYHHPISTLPPSITHLYLQSGIRYESEVLPPSLQYLRVGNNLDHPLPLLPPTLTSVILTPAFKATYTQGNFPNLVTEFKCLGDSDFKLSQLPAKIKSLTLWTSFSEPLENLSRFGSLTALTVGSKFNEPVDGKLPPTLTFLSLEVEFNQPVDNLPPNLLVLELGRDFNQSIDNLPPKLLSLSIHFGQVFSQEIHSLPADLQVLFLDVSILKLSNLDFIPPKLQELYLYATSDGAQIRNLPPTLMRLTLGTEEDQEPIPILELPPNLEILSFSGKYDPPGLSDLLPATLKILDVGYTFNQPLTSIPPSLKTLCIGKAYSHPLPPLPPTLRNLQQMSTELDMKLSDFPPRLFHIRAPHKNYELPTTCHAQSDYICPLCDEIRSPSLDFAADDKHWKDSFLHFFAHGL